MGLCFKQMFKILTGADPVLLVGGGANPPPGAPTFLAVRGVRWGRLLGSATRLTYHELTIIFQVFKHITLGREETLINGLSKSKQKFSLNYC